MAKKLEVNKWQSEGIVQSLQKRFEEDISVSIFVKRKIPKQSDYTMLYQEVTLELVKILKPNACKILLYLTSKLQYDNYIGVNQETIMEDLGYGSKKTIVQGIKELVELNVVITLPDLADKRRNVYYINPYQSWKGKVWSRLKAIKKFLERDPNQLTLPFTDKTI